MRKFSLSRKFTLNGIFTYVALFCVATFALLEHTSVSISAFSSVKLPLMYLGMLCIVAQIKTISRCVFKKKYFFVLLAVVAFCFLLFLTIFTNRGGNLGGTPLYSTVRLILYLIEMFLLMIVLAETGRAKAAINFLFWYYVAIAVVNDALMFSRLLTFGTARHESYIVGSKFSVAYLHMNLLTFWSIRSQWHNRKKLPTWIVLLAAAFIIGMAVRVDCMTGIVGCVALVFLFGLVESPKRKKLIRFTSANLLMLVLGASVLFVVVAETLMEMPLVQFVVENVFERDATLTGRTKIFKMFFEVIEGNWLDGYGYGNGNIVTTTLMGYANVQNALLQWVLQVGIMGTAGLVVVMYTVFRQIQRKRLRNMDMILPLVALIYMYIFLGSVETTFNMAFILWFGLIFMMVNERQPQLPESETAVRARQ